MGPGGSSRFEFSQEVGLMHAVKHRIGAMDFHTTTLRLRGTLELVRCTTPGAVSGFVRIVSTGIAT
jgi:hypothetical protein